MIMDISVNSFFGRIAALSVSERLAFGEGYWDRLLGSDTNFAAVHCTHWASQRLGEFGL
jgi:hypothetical protein